MIITRDEFPVLCFEFRGELSFGDMDRYMSLLQERFRSHTRFGIVIVANDLSMPGISVLKHYGNWLQEYNDTMREYCVAVGLVLNSAMLRGALRFVNSLAPASSPQNVCADFEEAWAWVSEQCRRAGI